MSNNQLRYIILGGLFLVPFVPLIVMKSLFFPFITGKAFVFRFLVEIIFAAWAVLAIRDSEYRPKFSWILGAILLFLAVIGVADIFSENPFKSFWSNYERMEGFVSLLHFVAFFVVLGSVLKTQQIWNKLLVTSICASAIMAIYSFFQLAGKIAINQGGVRVDGTFGNASYLAIYMVFHIFLAGLLFARSKVPWQKIALGILALANIFILYHTATRGAILGLLGGAVLTFGFLFWKSEKGQSIKKISLVFLVGLVAMVALFALVRNTAFVQNSYVLDRFASLSSSDIQSQGRYYVWPMAWKGVLEKPILGWGQESFNFVFNKYYDPRMYTQEPWFDRTHDIVLDWLVNGGILGLLSYLSIFGALLYYIWKANTEFLSITDKAIILGMIVAYSFHNLFVFDQIGSYILFFLVLAYVHAHTPETPAKYWQSFATKLQNLFNKEQYKIVFESFALIFLVIIVYFVTYIPWQTNKNLLAVLGANNQGQIGSLELYTKPLQDYNMGFPESLEHVSQTAISFTQNPNVTPELRDKLFEAVDQAFQIHLGKIPNDARYRLFYGLFLSRYGWYGRAIEQLEIAKALSPNKQSIKFELVSNLLLDGKAEEALSVAENAYKAETSFEEAKFIYGLTALAVGDSALSLQILKDVPHEQIIFDDRYLTVLLSINRLSEIIEVAKERVRLQPQKMEHRITLTAAYLQAGRRGEAVQILEEMIKLDPSFKEKGEYYISEIKAGRNP